MTMLHMCTILLTLTVCRLTATNPQPEVTAPAGTFRGKVLTSFSGADYVSYRGIPFALPPTGERRFAKPVPNPPIQGIFDASNFGPMCPQNWKDQHLGQEDCLYINVYTPLGRQITEKHNLKKVLVFIHGGGLVVGSSNPYLPGDIVTMGDLVVVTMNYRVTWFGFLRGNSSSLPGNAGFRDQLLALQWVQDNIKYFGGDPRDVTLSGESAGSFSVSVLSVLSQSKGLFSKVVLISGIASVLPFADRTINDLLQMAADRFGCGVDSLPGNEDQVVACLKQLPAETFLQDFDFPLLLFGPSSGDDLLPRPLLDLLSDNDYLSDVGFENRDYLATMTRSDGIVLTDSIFGQVDTSSIETIVNDTAWFLQLPAQVSELVFLEYEKLYPNVNESVISVTTDKFLLRKILDFLNAFTSCKQQVRTKKQRKSYLMLFNHVPIYVPNHYMLHALDLCYFFDLLPEDLVNLFYLMEVGNFTDEDLELKADYIDLMIDFVRTGKPGKRLAEQKHFYWPPYESHTQSYLSFSLDPSIGEDPLGDRRVIWEEYIPEWLEENGTATK